MEVVIPCHTLSGGNVWYDTTTNLVKRCDDNSTWTSGYSLPICIVTSNGSSSTGSAGIASINQIFDWCGYIGAAAFVLPGVKGLIPNGFNTDGTYKSIGYTTDRVISYEQAGTYSNFDVLLTIGNRLTGYYVNLDTQNNVLKGQGGEIYKDRFVIGKSSCESGKITSLTPATVQPSTTTIPINAIYNGSQLVYQYVPAGKTFNAATYFQTYVVPKGIRKLQVDCVAARGYNGRTAGKGGRVTCILAVTPGQTLYLWVPIDPTTSGGYVYNAADIRTIGGSDIYNTDSLNSRLVVAGGGGYSSNEASSGAAGGAGGGLTGAAGGSVNYGGGGGGGTQTAGGAAGGQGAGLPGWSGVAGTFGKGGVSNDWKQSGGSGWYGGGGGGASAYYGDGRGGGGGGSSYTNPTLCSNVNHTQGYCNGAGYITITPTK